MTDPEKICIRQLDDNSNYTLWRIRVIATIDAKSPSDALQKDAAEDLRREASNIIVSTLSDQALRVVRSVIGEPSDMLEKLDARHNFKSTASKISKISELVGTRYASLQNDVSAYCDKKATLFEQIRNMGTTLDDSLAIGLVVSSIDVPELYPVTASIKTLSDEKFNWDYVTNRRMEDAKAIKTHSSEARRANAAVASCSIYNKPHSTSKCFLNPLREHCKIPVKQEAVQGILNRNSGPGGWRRRKNGGSKRNDSVRAAMPRAHLENLACVADKLMLDSGTTAHLTPHANKVRDKNHSSAPVTLADDTTIRAQHTGTREVLFKTDQGTRRISLTNTLNVPDISASLLSIPVLVQKDIVVLFMTGNAVLFDLINDLSIFGYGEQHSDGIFYVADDGSTAPANAPAISITNICGMMAKASSNISSSSDASSDIALESTPEREQSRQGLRQSKSDHRK